jgi:hypothetical protein
VPGRGLLAGLRANMFSVSCGLHSLLDWPLRSASGGRLLSRTKPVHSAKQSYDEQLARELWDVSAEFAKV